MSFCRPSCFSLLFSPKKIIPDTVQGSALRVHVDAHAWTGLVSRVVDFQSPREELEEATHWRWTAQEYIRLHLPNWYINNTTFLVGIMLCLLITIKHIHWNALERKTLIARRDQQKGKNIGQRSRIDEGEKKSEPETNHHSRRPDHRQINKRENRPRPISREIRDGACAGVCAALYYLKHY